RVLARGDVVSAARTVPARARRPKPPTCRIRATRRAPRDSTQLAGRRALSQRVARAPDGGTRRGGRLPPPRPHLIELFEQAPPSRGPSGLGGPVRARPPVPRAQSIAPSGWQAEAG